MIRTLIAAILSLVLLAAACAAPPRNPAQCSHYPPRRSMLRQFDSRGQRIADFSQCGYRSGTEPLPNVTALIPQDPGCKRAFHRQRAPCCYGSRVFPGCCMSSFNWLRCF